MLAQRMTASCGLSARPPDIRKDVRPAFRATSENGDECHPSRIVVASTIRSRDVHDLAEQARPNRLDLLQTDHGSHPSEVVQAQCGGVLLRSWQFGQSFIHRGGRPAGRVTFLLSNSIHASAVWRGHALGFNELAVSGSGPEIDMASGSGFRMLVASFPIDMVNEAAASLQYQIDLDDKTSRSVAIGQSVAVDVRNTWSGLLERAADGQDHPSAPDCLACECEELLRHLLLACALRPGNAAKVAERSERRRVVARALAAISDDPGEPMSIAALCRTTGASERTLHYAFKEHFNVSPARFLKLHRLHGAFRDLRRLGDAHSKTSDVANEWGFWHLGQFAKDFRDLFGELPSETYRRTLSQAGMLHHEGAQD